MTTVFEPLSAGVLSAAEGVSHGFFTREGGVSEGLYASLNCGPGSGDDAASVATNRDRVAAEMGVAKDRLITAYQVHGTRVALVNRPWKLADAPEVDGMVTDERGLALGVLVADCAPVLFADPAAGVVGTAHAGWRGAKEGVLEETVAAMTHLGASASAIIAAVGPCIAQDSYEVGPEFPGPFLEDDSSAYVFFRPGKRRGRFNFDLAGYVIRRLKALGLARVESIGGDTCTDEERFFSYRRSNLRGESDYGRNLAVIALDK